MQKLLTTCAALAVMAMVALPAPASAAEHHTAGVTRTVPTDISAARRIHHRYYRHHYVRRYWGPRYGYYAPYNAYAYDPYYRPGFSVGVGPFGFGFGF